MKAAIFKGKAKILIKERPKPEIMESKDVNDTLFTVQSSNFSGEILRLFENLIIYFGSSQ